MQIQSPLPHTAPLPEAHPLDARACCRGSRRCCSQHARRQRPPHQRSASTYLAPVAHAARRRTPHRPRRANSRACAATNRSATGAAAATCAARHLMRSASSAHSLRRALRHKHTRHLDRQPHRRPAQSRHARRAARPPPAPRPNAPLAHRASPIAQIVAHYGAPASPPATCRQFLIALRTAGLQPASSPHSRRAEPRSARAPAHVFLHFAGLQTAALS